MWSHGWKLLFCNTSAKWCCINVTELPFVNWASVVICLPSPWERDTHQVRFWAPLWQEPISLRIMRREAYPRVGGWPGLTMGEAHAGHPTWLMLEASGSWTRHQPYGTLHVWAMQKSWEHLPVKWGKGHLVYRYTECGLHGGIQLSSCETREISAYRARHLGADAHRDHSHADSCLCSTARTLPGHFSQELRSAVQEPAIRNIMPHSPELSLQQSKADNCIWAYCCFRKRLKTRGLDAIHFQEHHWEGCLGRVVYFHFLAWFFILLALLH